MDEYLHTSFKSDVHFVDGKVEERNVGEKTHSRIQRLLEALFVENSEQ